MEEKCKAALGTALIVAALLPAAARADYGFYLGGDIGQVSVEEFFDEFDFDASTEAWRVYGGYRLSDYLGFEAGYVNFGTLDERVDIGATFVPISADAEGYTVGATIGWPLTERLSFNGRGGFLFWDSENLVDDVRLDESDENFFYGAGLKLDLTRNLSLTGDWTRYELDEVDAETIAAGIQFRFR